MTKRLLVGVLCALSAPYAQQRVDARNTHFRLLCVVPMVGSGADNDPRRPAFAPVAADAARWSSSGIIAYTYQLSDDGKYALVEFVARDRSAFRDIRADKSQSMKAFDKGKDRREDIEQEFKKYKKDFDINKFGTIVP